MLVIRMQRTGRKGHAQFRVVVQDKRRTPTSGKIVASLGSYNPHTKTSTIDKEKAAKYLEHGAQPSERVVRLLTAEGVKLPKWVETSSDKSKKVRNPDKRRSTRPAEPDAPAEEIVEPDVPANEVVDADPAADTEVTSEEAVETPAVDAPAAEPDAAEAEPTADAEAKE